MFKQFLQYVPGADLFMIASLAVFLIFFIGVVAYLLTGNKKRFEEMANLPFQENANL